MPINLIPSALKPIRVLLVDDHRSILWGLERLIESEKSRMEIVGKATSCAEAVDLAAKVRPDVILLDLDLGGESALGILPDLLAMSKARVLVLTGVRDQSVHDNAVLAGARGVVEKEDPAETILKAIEKVHQGEMWLNRITTGRIFVELSRRNAGDTADPEQQKIDTLTARERKIIVVLADHPGASAKAVAGMLNISEHTLRNHLTSIYDKLGVASRLELFAYANKRGLHRDAPSPESRGTR